MDPLYMGYQIPGRKHTGGGGMPECRDSKRVRPFSNIPDCSREKPSPGGKSRREEKQHKAAWLSAHGYRASQIAEELNVHRGTIWRWRTSPGAYMDAYPCYRAAVIDSEMKKIYDSGALDHSNPWVAQRAAIRLLNLGAELEALQTSSLAKNKG